MNEALRAEIARAIANSSAAITVIVQLREGGGDDPALTTQLAEANAAMEAAIGGAAPPANGPPEAT